MGATLVKLLLSVGTSILTEKVLLNFLLILASWAAKKTATDLDDNLVAALKANLDTSQGVPQGNLYNEIKAKVPDSK